MLIRNVPLEYKLVQILWKAIWQCQIFLNVHILLDSTIQRIYLMDNLVHVIKIFVQECSPKPCYREKQFKCQSVRGY